jgi:hypothetical protein
MVWEKFIANQFIKHFKIINVNSNLLEPILRKNILKNKFIITTF